MHDGGEDEERDEHKEEGDELRRGLLMATTKTLMPAEKLPSLITRITRSSRGTRTNEKDSAESEPKVTSEPSTASMT